MKFCRKCRIFYSSQAAACPKCGVSYEAAKESEIAEGEADKRSVRRDWLWLAIGVPLFIGLIYLLIVLFKSIG
ncbi:MAG: hypothetical protein K6F68_08335 [Clostridiales bacterium]|nr:hypothetical protein [Clostridiales bacterium]